VRSRQVKRGEILLMIRLLLLLLNCVTDSVDGSQLQHRLLSELAMVKGAVVAEDGFCRNITVPIMEDLHLRTFPPLDVAYKHLDFACFHGSVSLSTQQEVMSVVCLNQCFVCDVWLGSMLASMCYSITCIVLTFNGLQSTVFVAIIHDGFLPFLATV